MTHVSSIAVNRRGARRGARGGKRLSIFRFAPCAMRSAVPVLLIASSLCTASCGNEHSPTPAVPAPDIPFEEEGTLVFLSSAGAPLDTIQIEIADTDSARTRGLMQRSGLPPKSGMLFVFDHEEPQSFWMANTPLSLDMFFVNADSQVVTVRKYTRPFSPESVASTAPARFVIETVAGYADSQGITEGTRVRWWRGEKP